jgi:hypothetical protein
VGSSKMMGVKESLPLNEERDTLKWVVPFPKRKMRGERRGNRREVGRQPPDPPPPPAQNGTEYVGPCKSFPG